LFEESAHVTAFTKAFVLPEGKSPGLTSIFSRDDQQFFHAPFGILHSQVT
jgi:hypothetical protein